MAIFTYLPTPLVPAKAGTQVFASAPDPARESGLIRTATQNPWIPAFAEMTGELVMVPVHL
jgi:hypothetical protein